MVLCNSSGTFGVQDFHVNAAGSSLCFTCVFAEWTDCSGCLVEFFARNQNSTIVQTTQIMRKPSELSKTDCVSTTLANDLFHFTVYDIRSDGEHTKSPSIVLDYDITMGLPETPTSSELSCNHVELVGWLQHFKPSTATNNVN